MDRGALARCWVEQASRGSLEDGIVSDGSFRDVIYTKTRGFSLKICDDPATIRRRFGGDDPPRQPATHSI